MGTMNTTANAATANNQLSQGKRVGGFQGKHHDLCDEEQNKQNSKSKIRLYEANDETTARI